MATCCSRDGSVRRTKDVERAAGSSDPSTEQEVDDVLIDLPGGLPFRPSDGRTTLSNLVLLCRRHHALQHAGQLHLHDRHVPSLHTSINDPPVP